MIISKNGNHNVLQVDREEAAKLIQALSAGMVAKYPGVPAGFPVIRG